MSMIFDRPPWPSRDAVLLGAVALGLLLLAGLTQVLAGEVVAAAASPAAVTIDNFAFAPATLTVTAGTTVTWKNEDVQIGGARHRRHLLPHLRSTRRVPVYLHDPSLHGRQDHRQTRRQGLLKLSDGPRRDRRAAMWYHPPASVLGNTT